jgi:Virus neck protein
MGFDGMYCPIVNSEDRDILYGEDPVKKFSSAFPVEFYLSSSMEYGGEREFFSKFGLEIKNNINVILSKRSFTQRVPQDILTRPREGDLIYVPFLNGTGELFEIKFVNQTKDFFMLGRKIPYYYELEMEKFKYSQEVIDTGVFEIDDVVSQSGYTIDLSLTKTGPYNYSQKEIVYQSNDNTYANAIVTATVQNWSNTSNTLSVTNITGEFVDNKLVIGVSSNARHMLLTFDPLADASRNEVYDNQHIFSEANTIIDFSEINPFGPI